jgi:hypothetical protein
MSLRFICYLVLSSPLGLYYHTTLLISDNPNPLFFTLFTLNAWYSDTKASTSMMFLIPFFYSSAGETSDFAPCSWTSTQNNSCCGMFIIWLKFALLPFG